MRTPFRDLVQAVLVLAAGLLGGCSDEQLSPTSPATQAASSAGSGGAGTGSGGATGSGGVSYPDAYTAVVFDAVRIASHDDQPNFQRATGEVTFDQAPFASVTLVVDLATTCYPFETWKDNPPPTGENWPADCDAFDRNFDIALDVPKDPLVGPPAIELLHAITPFGGPLHVELDVTDVANGMAGKHAVEVRIPTWSDAAGLVSGSNGGWNVSARFEVTPGPAPRKVLGVIPLYRDIQTTGAPGSVDFEVPAGATEVRLEYRASGHGGAAGGSGCIGPAEEFCHRTHVLSLDGAELATLDAWRTDCDDLCTLTHYGEPSSGFDYCLENPCGAISSVKAPRANWCPGSVTPPLVLSPAAMPGPHTFGWTLSAFVDGGIWAIAAHAIAFGGD